MESTKASLKRDSAGPKKHVKSSPQNILPFEIDPTVYASDSQSFFLNFHVIRIW
jgi:hypothetical protein